MSDSTSSYGNPSGDPLEVARAAAARADWPSVVAATEAVLSDNSSEPTALFLLGTAHLAQGAWQEARSPLETLATIAPDIKEVHAYRAQVAQMTGAAADLIGALRELVRCDPNDQAAGTQLAHWALLFGEPDAHDLLARALKTDPTNQHLALIAGELVGAAETVGPATPNRVVLVSDNPRVREAKIAQGLRDSGKEVHLVCARPPGYDGSSLFASIQTFDSPWQAPRLAAALHPEICHVFSLMQYETAAAMLTVRPAPVLVDPYDNADMLSAAFVATEPTRNLERALERSIFGRADGLVCRNLESQVAVRRDGLALQGPRLFYSDYCWGDIARRDKLSTSDGELHLVYGGTVWLESRSPEGADHGLLWLAETAAKHGVHLHVYPTVAGPDEFEEMMAEYRAFESGTRFFHLHRPLLDHRAFLEEISQYDIGVLVRRSLVTGGQAWQYAPEKHRYSYANKLADYLDAGLYFMIAPQHLLSFGLARRLGIGIAATPAMFDRPFWDNLKQNVLDPPDETAEARQNWSLEANAPRLARFYAQVMAGT